MTQKTRWLTYEERCELEEQFPSPEATAARARRLRARLHHFEAQIDVVKAELRELRELEARRALKTRARPADEHEAAQLKQARGGR